MYLYKTDTFFHISHYFKSVSKVAVLHRFHCSFLFFFVCKKAAKSKETNIQASLWLVQWHSESHKNKLPYLPDLSQNANVSRDERKYRFTNPRIWIFSFVFQEYFPKLNPC